MAKLTSDRLHALLQQLLLFQKNKHEVKTTLSAINFLLDGKSLCMLSMYYFLSYAQSGTLDAMIV